MGLRQQVAAIATELKAFRQEVSGHAKSAELETMKATAARAEAAARSAEQAAHTTREEVSSLGVSVRNSLDSIGQGVHGLVAKYALPAAPAPAAAPKPARTANGKTPAAEPGKDAS